MTLADPAPPVRRILVALDASAGSLTALEAAATLAARVHAELLGLFIEDINLLHLAGLPLAAEVSIWSARARPLTPGEMEQRLRAQAVRAQSALARVAARFQVRSVFRVARGQIAAELLSAAIEADLVAVGATSGEGRGVGRFGSTAQALMARATRPLLILPRGATIRAPIGLIYDDSPLSQQALALAVHFAARLQGAELVVLLLADSTESEQRLREGVESRLDRAMTNARYRWLVQASPEAAARAIREERIGALALAADIEAVGWESMGKLLERTDCAVLLVRR